MQLNELFNNPSQHISFCFGRFQPPHAGHGKLMETTAEIGGDYMIYASASQDSKKNPLSFDTKVEFIKTMFPKIAEHVSSDANLNTVMKIAASLYEQGYRSATFVAGQDQIATFTELLNKYNGKQAAHGYYQFHPLQFVASDSPDVRATQIRESVSQGDFDKFKMLTGADHVIADALYVAVENGMNITETVIPHIPIIETTEVKSSKSQAEYVAKSTTGKHCHDCTMFRAPNKCTAVEGIISPQGYCKYFKLKKVVESSENTEYILFINGNPSVKYQDFMAAKREMAMMKSKFPNKTFELKAEECDLIPVKENKKKSKSDPCWSGYRQLGTKKKSNKTVPNCVPVAEDISAEIHKLIQLLEYKNTHK